MSCISGKEKLLAHSTALSEETKTFAGHQICNEVIKSTEEPVRAAATGHSVNSRRIVEYIRLSFQ